jgi:hypothetical protein
MTARGMDDDTLFSAGVSIPSHVLSQELPDEELVFLDLKNESYFGLDAVGTRMYKAVTEAESIEQAYQTLLGRFKVEPERLRSDLRAFVQRLMERGILELRA